MMQGQPLPPPHEGEADMVCSRLVREIHRARCWAHVVEASDALLRVRSFADDLTREINYLKPDSNMGVHK